VTPDIDKVSAYVREAARAHILPRFERLAASDVREKSPGDLVTVADLETEQALTPLLRDLMPGSLVVGEEATAADPSLLRNLEGEGRAWLIDPVDGTANFAAGLPLFAVMVAYAVNGEIVASWIYDPKTDRMAVAARGSGAWLDGVRLSVADAADAGSMSGSLSIRFGNRHLVRRIAGRSNMVGSVFSFRCAGHEYLALASGRAHFALYHRLMPWDHAPGFLLHREAGGFGRRLDRSLYTPCTHDGGLLLAPDEASWEELHQVLIGK
jgi:fructose-1,6-bisphosphatase/inositol monophosphatase family enzyme